MTNLKILVAVPMFNCAKQIIDTLDSILQYQHGISEVWIIDNRSTDQSSYIVEEYLKSMKSLQIPMKLFRNKENIGLGGTHKITFKMAYEKLFSHVLIFHGDHQAQGSDLATFIEIAQNKPHSIILGSRFMRKSSRIGYSKSRTFANYIFNFLLSIRERKIVKDLGSGLNIFPIKVIQNINLTLLPNDLTFNIALLRQLIHSNAEIIWQPIKWKEEDQISNVKIISQTLATLRLIIGQHDKSYHKSNYTTERIR
jgi:glycosyltransferase involved in cell wall biosynthesis